MNNILIIDRILDYCDVPQLFTARDTFDALYLCLLYDDTSSCMYTGIRISQTRLNDFMTNKIDLRQIYLNPEISEEYFDVSCQDNICYKTRLTDSVLPEDKLPSEGYKISDDGCENILISIPSKDRPLLKELVRKFGWACM